MTLLGSEWWVIVCGWVDGGEAFVDLKEINAKCGSGFLRMGVFLRALRSQLPALIFAMMRILLRRSGVRGTVMKELGSEKVGRRWVIFCGWIDGGDAFVDLKEINAKCGGGFGGIEGFQPSASGFALVHRGNFRFG
jgi:hypothetical protein